MIRGDQVLFRHDDQLYRHPPREIARRVKAEIPAARKILHQKIEPAPPEEIIMRLTRLSLHFWQPDRPREHFKEIMRDYVEDLGHLPADILEETIRRWRRKGKFWPKVSELLEISQPLMKDHGAELRFLGMIESALNTGPVTDTTSPSEQEKERVARQVINLTRALTTDSRPPPYSQKPKRSDRGQQPTEEEAAEYERLYRERMTELAAAGLPTEPFDSPVEEIVEEGAPGTLAENG